MGVIHVTDRAGQRHTLEAIEGWRVMEIIRFIESAGSRSICLPRLNRQA